jgi:hypothetical protein
LVEERTRATTRGRHAASHVSAGAGCLRHPGRRACPCSTCLQLNIPGGALPGALAELAAQAGFEILFDEQILADAQVAPLTGVMSADEALRRLLAGTRLGYHCTSDGLIVLYRLAEPAAGGGDGAIPEILVIGRRTQNVDIRRTENDIQPYKVATRAEIERAHRSNVEDFTRGRVPANAQTRTFAQDTTRQRGVTRSALDLRGLGRRRTLVLLDGKRLPSVRTVDLDFDQPDLNGILLSAIERIETLTGTAGGIYGPSALGGVVVLAPQVNTPMMLLPNELF